MADEIVMFNGYDLSNAWFNFCLENPDKVKPIHTALFFWIVQTFNKFSWKAKVGLPTDYAMEVLGIKSYNTYSKTLNDIIDFGFVVMVEKSRNQYSSNIIALSKNDKARVKATLKQSESIVQSTGESIDSIIKLTKHTKPLNEIKESSRFTPPSLLDVKNLIIEKKYLTVGAESFWNFYESKNWMVGKNKMKDWKKAIAGWESRNKEKSNQNQNGKAYTGQSSNRNR